MYVYVCICMYMYIYVCMYVSMYLCIYVSMYLCMYVCMCIYIYCDYPELWTHKNEHVAWYVREFMGALEDFDHCVSIDHLAQQCSIDPRNCKSRGPWCFKKVECNWVFPSFRSSVHETPGDSKDLEGFSGWRIYINGSVCPEYCMGCHMISCLG